MAYKTKRLKNIAKNIDFNKTFDLNEAIAIIKENANAKFNETIEVSVALNIDTKKPEQNVRNVVILPHGVGKKNVIAVFAKDQKAKEAKEAGADIVGDEDLLTKVLEGDITFNRCIATPDMMSLVGRAGKVLGPKGLMPNPKLGTVTNDVVTAIDNIKKGQIEYKTDKNGIINAGVGKRDFSIEQLKENILSFIDSISKSKPATIKGNYIKKMSISSTMGIGITFVI